MHHSPSSPHVAHPLPSRERLRLLREAIHARSAAPPVPRIPTGWARIDAALNGGLPMAGLHEWWGESDAVRSACVHLAWRAMRTSDADGVARRLHAVWVGRIAWPGPEDLVRGMRAALSGMFGADAPREWPDASLHDRSLLVDVPGHDAGARLWAIEQAARCPGACVVVADGQGFDHAATRRLQLAASTVPVLLLRGGPRRASAKGSTASACATRWCVRHADRHDDIGERAPWLRRRHALAACIAPEPSWTVRLERAKGMDMALAVECEVRAFRAFEWEGTERMPAPLAARARRRHRRIAELGLRPGPCAAQHAGVAAPHASVASPSAGVASPSAAPPAAASSSVAAVDPAPPSAAPRRGRGLGRMTSRGERWAHEVPGAASKAG